MSKSGEKDDARFADEAFAAFTELMSGNQKDMLESINRANKGELFVLHFLSMHDEALLPSELSAALQASPARISALLSALEKKGQIVRDIDEANRRNILVTITEDGRRRAETEMHVLHKCIARVFMEMGEADTLEFIRLTKRFFALSQKYMPCQPETDESNNK